jgi:hypothetical protein
LAGVVVDVVVAAVLDAALSTVAPMAPPAIDPATIAATTPLRIKLNSAPFVGDLVLRAESPARV